MNDLIKLTVDELRLLYYGPTCADVAGVDLFDELARRAQANDALMDAAQRVADRCPKPRPGVAQWTSEGEMAIEALRAALAAAPAPSSPRDVQIDRLLAAPPARKLAEEPAQEDDGPCLSALLANMRMEMSDGANGMRTPREEAIAAVVECVARRIEALENNKEARK